LPHSESLMPTYFPRILSQAFCLPALYGIATY
jgi:hypothetical protein